MQGAEIGNLKLDGNSAVGAILLQDLAHEGQVFGEGLRAMRLSPACASSRFSSFSCKGT